MSTQGFSGEAGTFIAVDRGYFQAEGLDVSFVPNLQGPSALAALLSGDVDFSANAMDVSLINAVQRNIDERIVAPLTYIPPEDKNAAIIVRKDLVDSGAYKQPSDFKGMTIGIGQAPKTSAQLFVEKALAKGNLKASDANLQTIGFPDMLPALANKKMDASWEIEPLATVAEDQKIATEVLWAGQLFPNYDPFLYIVAPKFATGNPDAVKRFTVAFLRGQRDYYNAFQKNIGGQAAKDAIIQSLVAHTTIKDPKTYQELTDKGRMQSVDPNGAFHIDGFNALQDYWIQVGTAQNKIDLNKSIDSTAMDYALQRLGKVS